MNDISPQVIQLCGLAVGVGILILLAGLLVLRIGKSSVFGLGTLVVRMFMGGMQEEDETPVVHNAHAHSADDLRAKVESLDFDAAVQKYRTGEAPRIDVEKDDD